MANGPVDPFTLAVIQASLVGVARDMKIMTMRTAYTELWKEQGDLSCCIMDAAGDIVAQDPNGFPIHVTTMPMQLKGVLDSISRNVIHPGDILATNDPYIGGTHLPDVLIVKPLFHRGEIYAFACNRGHWSDIGGVGPGSYSPATTDIHQEGLFIPPVKLFEAGVPNDGVMNLIMANIRNRSVGRGDLRAQYASCITADKRLSALIAQYGFEVVTQSMTEILNRSERFTRERISEIPDGIYAARDCIDGDGFSDEPRWIDVRITVQGSDIQVDLSGSDTQSKGGMNCSHSVAASAVQFAVKALTDPENPPNAGSYRPVAVSTRPGTICDAEAPASIIGYGEIGYRVMDATFAALAPGIGEKAVASGSGSTGTVVISGRLARSSGDKYFTTLELSSGAHGARSFADGINAMRCGPGNAGSVPIEVDEMMNPLRYERFEIAIDTGGAGKFRGGNGLVRAFRVLGDQAQICICADRHVTPPPGVFGGRSGRPASFVLDAGTTHERALSSKTPYIPLKKGTLVTLQSAGGGGYGDPVDRDPKRLGADILNGYVSLEAAARDYDSSRNAPEGADERRALGRSAVNPR
jgi:N-methylhydantoinase B